MIEQFYWFLTWGICWLLGCSELEAWKLSRKGLNILDEISAVPQCLWDKNWSLGPMKAKTSLYKLKGLILDPRGINVRKEMKQILAKPYKIWNRTQNGFNPLDIFSFSYSRLFSEGKVNSLCIDKTLSRDSKERMTVDEYMCQSKWISSITNNYVFSF